MELGPRWLREWCYLIGGVQSLEEEVHGVRVSLRRSHQLMVQVFLCGYDNTGSPSAREK